MNEVQLYFIEQVLLLVFAFELCVPASTACIAIKMLSHVGPLLASRTRLFDCSDLS